MIEVKNNVEVEYMREAGRISALALKAAGEAVRPGVSTFYLDKIARKVIEDNGATPSFLGEGGFPATCCISVNEEIIHAIPKEDKFLFYGDIVSIDVGACYKGYHGDNACTFICGRVAKGVSDLLKVTRDALYFAIDFISSSITTGDLGAFIQKYVESRGFAVVKNYSGHGIGKELHEEPKIPNYGNPGEGVKFKPGMTVAIEPMVVDGCPNYKILPDGWTVVTLDGSISAHFENTVLITENGAEILTKI